MASIIRLITGKSTMHDDLSDSTPPHRWMAEIYYHDAPMEIVTFEELEELHDIVERGPDWNTIDRIVVSLNRTAVEPFPSENWHGG